MPTPAVVFLGLVAASMRAQIHADGITPRAAHNTILDVANFLAQGILIVIDKCELLLSENTEPEGDSKPSGEGENKIVTRDDHALDGLRYAIRSTIVQWQCEVYALAA